MNNPMMSKIATSICLPRRILATIAEQLIKKKIERYSYQKIVLLCLRRYLSSYQPEKFDNRPTCRYNKEKCDMQVKVYLTDAEHHNVKMHRVLLQQSASYLCFLAVEEFLPEILDLLEALNTSSNSSSVQQKLELLYSALDCIHRKNYFKAANVFGLVIVIPKPSEISAEKQYSGHRGLPFRLRRRSSS